MIRETLTRTKAVLEERGWGRDWVENDRLPVCDPKAGHVCLATAVALACGYKGDSGGIQEYLERGSEAAMQAALTAMAAEAGVLCPASEPVRAIAAWNDELGRTKEQVHGLIDRTAVAIGKLGL